MTETRSPHFGRDANVQTYTSIHLPRVFAPWARVLLEVVPPYTGDVVLDVATGPGTVARHAARLVGASGRVTGVDISAAMLAVGRGWAPEPDAAPIEYVESSASSIPLQDTAYDVAYCQQGLQHMADPLAALGEMLRVLKVGGRLGVAVWTQSPFGIFRQVVADMGMADDGPQPSTFGRESEQLRTALYSVGFEDVQVRVREHVAVLEGGISQALRVAEATSGGAVMASLSAARQQALRDAIAKALEPHVKDGAVHLRSASNIAAARKPH